MTTPPSQAQIRTRRYYVLAVLTLVSFCNYMDRSIIGVLIEPIKADLKINDTQVGLLAGFTFAIFYASFGIPIARMADKRSRVRILSVAIMLWSLMTALSGMARNYLHLLIARIGVGVGEAGCVPASHSLIVDYFPPKERAFAISVFQAGGLAGVTVGLALAGMLAQAFGWRWTFAILGAPGVLIGLLALFTVPEPERTHAKGGATGSASDEGLLSTIASLLKQRTYRHILLGLALANFVTLGVGGWTAPFFIRVHGLSLAEVGVWLGASSGVGGVLGILVGGAASVRLVSRDRRWELWLPAASAALALPLYLVTFLSPVATIALIAKFSTAFVGSFGAGVGLASLQSVTPPHRRALGVAVAMFANAIIGMGAGPLVVGMLSDALTPEYGRFALRYAIVAVLGVSIWAIAHFLMASRSFRDDALN